MEIYQPGLNEDSAVTSINGLVGDVELVAGVGISITELGQDITITATGDQSVSLADVSANSTTTPLSLYTMTSTIPVEFRTSGASPLLYLDESNAKVLIGATAASTARRMAVITPNASGSTNGTTTATQLVTVGSDLYAAEYVGNGSFTGFLVTNTLTTGVPFVQFQNSANAVLWTIQQENAANGNLFSIRSGNAAATSRFQITTTGNVGIGLGLTAATAKLHLVAGTGDANNGAFKMVSGTDVAYVGQTWWNGQSGAAAGVRNWQIAANYQANGNFDIMRSTTNTGNPTTVVASFDNAGNMGLGTAAPAAKLHVSTGVDTDAGTITFLIGGSTGTNARTGRIIKDTTTPYTMTVRSGDFTGAGLGNDLKFQTNNVDGDRMLIKGNTGDVGIGTGSTVSARLHINTAAASSVIRLERGTTGIVSTDEYGAIEFFGNDASSNANGVRAKIVGISENNIGLTGLGFYTTTSSSTTLNEVLRVGGGLNVGIGTGATISAKLHVISTTEQLRLGYDSSNYASFTTSSTGNLTIQPSAGGNVTIKVAAGLNPKLNLADGNMTNPFSSDAYWTETNQIGAIGVVSSSAGGLLHTGFSGSDTNPLILRGLIGSASPTVAAIQFRAGKLSGTSAADLAASEIAYQFTSSAAGTTYATILGNGNLGIGISPTAVLTLKAGTATASTAPLKFTTGTLNTTAEAGAMEFLAERFTLTPTSLARQTISGALFTQTADATVANTVTETTLVGTGVGTMTLPANFFVAGKTLRLTWRGILSDTGTPTARIRVKLGSTTIGDTGAIALTGTITNEEWSVYYIMTCRTTGGSGTVFGQGDFHFDNSSSAGLTFGMPSTAATTIDTTASQVVSITIEWGTADAGDTITATNGILEVLN